MFIWDLMSAVFRVYIVRTPEDNERYGSSDHDESKKRRKKVDQTKVSKVRTEDDRNTHSDFQKEEESKIY